MDDQPRLLIRGARVLDLDGDTDRPPVADILVQDGRIVAVGPDLPQDGAAVLTAHGMLAVPGFVNAHYHSHDVLLRGRFEQMPLEVWSLWTQPGRYPPRPAAEVALRTRLGALENLRGGITTVQDMVTIVGPEPTHAEALIDAYAQTGIRAVVALQIADLSMADTLPFGAELPPAIAARLPPAQDPAAMLAFADSLLARGSDRLHWALGPSGPQRVSETVLEWVAARSAAQDLQIFTHTYETRTQAVQARLSHRHDSGSLVQRLKRHGLLGPRLTVAHGVWSTKDEIALLGAAGANLVTNPMSNLKLLSGIAPIALYAQAGVNLALGCDGCSCSDVQNIFQAMKGFAQFWAWQHDGTDEAAAAESAARAAFRAATLGGARALGLAGEVGALRPGMRADIVLLDLADPAWRPLNSALRQLVYSETGRAVHTVLVDGRLVLQAGQMVPPADVDLVAAAEAARAALEPDLQALAAQNQHLAPEMLTLYRRAARYPLTIDRARLRPPGPMVDEA
jgi:5-methylthioadenosine/S-adenosylhomocysteine deaminase